MKNKKHVWVAGAMCVLPFMAMAQQVEPLTDSRRLFDDGKELFLRRDYAAAWQTLSRYVQQKPQASLADEAAYMLACTSYELKSPDCIQQLEHYLEQYPRVPLCQQGARSHCFSLFLSGTVSGGYRYF